MLEGVPLEEAYSAPAEVVGYRGGDLPDTPCAARGGVDFWREGAFYCDDERTIVFDEAWLRDFADRIGPFAPAAILAHEWGHHVQESFGPSTYSIQFELQADCFAGMYLAASEEQEPGTYVVGSDLGPALEAFFTVANENYNASDWFGTQEHGSQQQRMMAFGTGYLGISSSVEENPLPANAGLPWCYGYRDFIPNDKVDVGPFQFLNLPGRTETWQGSAYGIASDSRSGVKTSDIALAWIERLPLAAQGATQAQLDELWRQGYPGLTPAVRLTELAQPTFGTSAAAFFENRIAQTDGTELVMSGVFGLVSPADGVGGLLVIVSRGEPLPQTLTDESWAIFQEELLAYVQVTNRLCSPDESGEADAANLDVACMAVQ